MKQIFILLISTFFFHSFSQTTIVEYKLERNISEKNFKELPEFAKKIFSKDYFYTLTHCNAIVEYKISDSIIDEVADSENKKINEIEMDNSIQKYIYKDLTDNVAYSELFLIDEMINIKDKLIEREWKITSESKIINGYTCKKAVSKKFNGKTYAWFTEEIDIKTGPDFFDGLPGLILEINSKHFNWIATSVKKISKETILIKPEFMGKIYTFEEGKKLSKEKPNN